MKEFILAPSTGVGGSTGGVTFSPDKQQRFLFISDLTNNHIWFLNREDGKVVGQMGSMGENGGQFFGLHMIAVDSKGQHLHGRGVRRRARAAVRPRELTPRSTRSTRPQRARRAGTKATKKFFVFFVPQVAPLWLGRLRGLRGYAGRQRRFA